MEVRVAMEEPPVACVGDLVHVLAEPGTDGMMHVTKSFGEVAILGSCQATHETVIHAPQEGTLDRDPSRDMDHGTPAGHDHSRTMEVGIGQAQGDTGMPEAPGVEDTAAPSLPLKRPPAMGIAGGRFRGRPTMPAITNPVPPSQVSRGPTPIAPVGEPATPAPAPPAPTPAPTPARRTGFGMMSRGPAQASVVPPGDHRQPQPTSQAAAPARGRRTSSLAGATGLDDGVPRMEADHVEDVSSVHAGDERQERQPGRQQWASSRKGDRTPPIVPDALDLGTPW